MKKTSFKIQIENPCGEDWSRMEVKGDGRYCQRCTKVVVDFNAMTDAQIAEFLMKQSSSICGRISKTRMSTDFYFPLKRNTSVFNRAMLRYSLAGVLTLGSLKSFAQSSKPQTTQQLIDENGKKQKQEVKTEAAGRKLTVILKTEDGQSADMAVVNFMTAGFRKSLLGDTVSIDIPDSLVNGSLSITAHMSGYETSFKSILLNEIKTTALVELKLEVMKEVMFMGIVAPVRNVELPKTKTKKSSKPGK